MNKIKLTIILTLFAALCTAAYGQVTIGSNVPPNKGALLDLKDDKATGDVTASQGLLLPRVNLTNLKPTLSTGATNSLPVSIGSPASEDWSLSAHTGLTVYNVKTPDQCASDPIPIGVFTWTGTEWEYLGRSAGDELAPGVHEFTDPRDGEKYLYGNFEAAGDWMLENLRYIPKDGDGYPGYSESAANVALPYTTKYYAFPGPNGTYNSATAKTNWESGWRNTGVLYNWPAALNVGDGSGITIPNPGDVDQGDGQPGDNTASPVRGVCPENWHVPSDAEWTQLTDAIIGNNAAYATGSPAGAGQAMKSPCPIPGVSEATNGLSKAPKQNGFSVLLAGLANGGNTDFFGTESGFWSSSSNDRYTARNRDLDYNNSDVIRSYSNRRNLLSVRCKKD